MQTNNFEERLKRYAGKFGKVVPFQPTDKLLLMDFTDRNRELTDEILLNTDLFSQYVNDKLEAAGATYGIGGYDEHRTVYTRSKVFDTPDGGEPRRLHLGTDIWGPAETPVYAPLEGTVHSIGFN